jgi:hypothetical protein
MKDKIKSLTAMAMMSGIYTDTYKEDEVFQFTNPYGRLDTDYSFSSSVKTGTRKSNLNNNQKKSRAKSKRAKKSRRNNR